MKLLSIKFKVGQSDFPSSVKLVSNSLRGDVHHHPVDSCDASQCLTKDFVGTKTASSASARHVSASCLRLLFPAGKVFYWSLARELKYLQSASKKCLCLCERTKSCNFGRSLVAHYGVRGCCWTSCQKSVSEIPRNDHVTQLFLAWARPPFRWCAESKRDGGVVTRLNSRIIYLFFWWRRVGKKEFYPYVCDRRWMDRLQRVVSPCSGWAGELTLKAPREEESARYRLCEGKSKPGRSESETVRSGLADVAFTTSALVVNSHLSSVRL